MLVYTAKSAPSPTGPQWEVIVTDDADPLRVPDHVAYLDKQDAVVVASTLSMVELCRALPEGHPGRFPAPDSPEWIELIDMMNADMAQNQEAVILARAEHASGDAAA